MENLKIFLKLGYFLDYKNDKYKIDLNTIDRKKYDKISDEDLINMGYKLIINSVEKIFETNRKHLVPISGGLDSRTILATLLKFTKAENIYTYTFGTPNTLDYEIGNLVAKKVGTKHTNFPLTKYNYSQEELVTISKRIDHQTILFHHPPISKIDSLFGGLKYWSGYLGETLTGDHMPVKKYKNIEDTMNKFIDKNSYVQSTDISNIKLNQIYEHLDVPTCSEKLLSKYEQMDFYNRQLKFIAPHVLYNGPDYCLPFLDKDLVDFFLSVEDKYRLNQSLYKKILMKNFTDCFQIPTKNTLGLKLNCSKINILLKKIERKMRQKMYKHTGYFPNKYVNYLDFNKKIREDHNFRNIIKKNINDLKMRNIIDWIDPLNIYQRHLANKGDYSDALIVLASLEIHLKAGKIL